MSLHESLVATLILAVLTSSVMKWKKSLLVIVSLEMGSLLVLGSLLLFMGTLASSVIIVVVFLVGEALVLLASFYSSLQGVGASSGAVNFN